MALPPPKKETVPPGQEAVPEVVMDRGQPAEEVAVEDSIQTGQDVEFQDTVFAPQTVQDVETVEDANTFLRRHQRAVAAAFIKPMKDRRLAIHQLGSPRTVIDSTGAKSWPVKTLEVFDNLPSPKGQVSATGAGLLMATTEVAAVTTAHMSATDTLASASCEGALATTAGDITLSSTAQGALSSSLVEIVSFRWSQDLSALSWEAIDNPPSFTVNSSTPYILAVRFRLDGLLSASTLSLDYWETEDSPDPLGSGISWTTVGEATDVSHSTPSLYTAKSGGSVVRPSEFVCSSGGGTLVDGVFSTFGAWSIPTLSPGQETEVWFCMEFDGNLSDFWVFFRGGVGASTAVFPGPPFAPDSTIGLDRGWTKTIV